MEFHPTLYLLGIVCLLQIFLGSLQQALGTRLHFSLVYYLQRDGKSD